MGRLIIKYILNHKREKIDSFKCKSLEAAKKVVAKRRNIAEWNFYEDGENIPKPKSNKQPEQPMSFEEIEARIRLMGGHK